MNSFDDITPMWDFSQASSFSQLPDDDFLALLQKQFSGGAAGGLATFTDGINPQAISHYPLPTLTPPSEDSSPSPPGMDNSRSRSQSGDSEDHMLKRKASDDDLEEGPSNKNQHTSANNKKGAARRKSTGGGQEDNRLLKRKEQNRAAQRAFRERKEKHVKDLEDQVAALQAQNDQANTENENLRDLLSRLQNENVSLKQSTFTFAVAKTAAGPPEASPNASNFAESQFNHLRSASVSSPFSPATPVSLASPASPKPHNSTGDFDWGSLTAFDPAVLKLLDDSPQHTATTGAMNMDFGFGAPYTTIASNPFFTSWADSYDSPPSDNNTNGTHDDKALDFDFNFDMDSLQPWPTPPMPEMNFHSPGGSNDLEQLFSSSNVMGAPGLVDFNVLMKSPPSSLSPVSHASLRSNSVSSPSSSSNSNLSLFNTPRESSASMSEDDHEDHHECPKTKEQLKQAIIDEGSSSFAPAPSPPTVHKSADGSMAHVACQGSSLPRTEKSDKNYEVLEAWRAITSNPGTQGTNINELCEEFSKKARCDGHKVVLEPQGVQHILDKMAAKKQGV